MCDTCDLIYTESGVDSDYSNQL